MENNSKPNYAIPAAVMIAGLLIAGAVYFRGTTPIQGVNPSGEGDAAKTVALSKIIKGLKINQKDFNKCLASDKYEERVNRDQKNAEAMGVEGTPFNVLVNSKGQQIALPGAYPLAEVQKAITTLMAGKVDAPDPKLKSLLPIDATDHVLGDANAPITLIEYSDFSCPFCQRFDATLDELMKTEQGKNVKVVYRHLPLESIHPDARKLAIASECVNELGGNEKFWQFVDAVFVPDQKVVIN